MQDLSLERAKLRLKSTNNGSLNGSDVANSDDSMREFGVVLSIIDGVAKVVGLSNVLAGESVSFVTGGVTGMVVSLEKSYVKIMVFGNDLKVEAGDLVLRTFSVVSLEVHKGLIGRTVDALGHIIDDRGIIPESEFMETIRSMPSKFSAVDVKAPGVIYRSKINEPVSTGLIFIDTIVPIGRGQRESIIGDKQTGKSAVAIDSIINQKFLHLSTVDAIKKSGLFCIYVAIGQKRSSIVKLVNKLTKINSMFYTTVVSATASDAASLQYIAPYTGCTIGE